MLECKHPSSRKTLNLIKKTKKLVFSSNNNFVVIAFPNFRSKNRQLKKIGNAVKVNVQGKKLFWFYEQIEEMQGPLKPDTYKELIEHYLARFDEELEQINIKKGINKKRRANQHAARESVIKMTLEKEVGDFRGGGLELPNLCDANEFKTFQEWDGDSAKIQHLKMHFISRKWLDDLREKMNEENKMGE